MEGAQDGPDKMNMGEIIQSRAWPPSALHPCSPTKPTAPPPDLCALHIVREAAGGE